jgi:uncharacterized membrane protein YcaP (DUF421 family)
MESVLRGLAVYVFLLIIFRISGKRSLAESSSFDLVLLLIISETTQQAMVGHNHSMTNAMLLIVTLVGADILLSVIKQRFRPVDKWLDSLPVIVVKDGRLLTERTEPERVDEQDILEAARLQHGIESLSQIKYAVLERGGRVSIVPTPPATS